MGCIVTGLILSLIAIPILLVSGVFVAIVRVFLFILTFPFVILRWFLRILF